MLDAVSYNPRPVTMPVDYAAYLLSASPPGAGFQFLSRAYSGDCPITIHSTGLKQLSCFTPPMNNHKSHRLPPLKPIIVTKSDNFDIDESNNADVESEVECPASPLTPTSPDCKTKKKVSFADHQGRALATVRIMTEPSDVPPRIRPELLSVLTKGASAGVTEKSPLTLNFSQPASDYVQFRDKLNRNCVSLENVILKEYSLMGTIKVKNLSFDKNVFVRVTFDSWSTSMDLPANYASNTTDTQARLFDTFTFEVHVPTNYDPTKQIMFAVCFQSEGQEYWDSNDGKNYEVSSDTCTILSPVSTIPNTSDQEGPWTEFACWNNIDTSVPYW